MTDNIESNTETEVLPNGIQEVTVASTPSFLAQCINLTETAKNVIDLNELNIRCVHLADDRVFFAVLLLETPDSFVFGCPGRFEWNGTRVMLKPFLGRPMVRVFKTIIATLGFEIEEYAIYYYKYLQKFGPVLMPSYFNETINNKIEVLINQANSGKKETSEKKEEDGNTNVIPENTFSTPFISESIH